MHCLEREKEDPCDGCGTSLVEPYIHCAECRPTNINLCLYCFAKGTELGQHQSNHKYEVIKNDFPLFENGWTAREEKLLIDAISDCGVGNWLEIAAQVKSKHWKQCERHYTKHYINNSLAHFPEFFPDPPVSSFPCPMPAKASEDPPRPAEGSVLQADMSGYMAARGDFGVEHDNYAELDLRDLEFSEHDSEFDQKLNVTVVDVYQNVLRERHRRKKIIKDHGLVNVKRQVVYNRRYEKSLGPSLVDSLRPFGKCLSAGEFDKYMESLHYERELRNDIKRLQECRENGITRLHSSKVYNRLKYEREEDKAKRKLLADVVTANSQSDLATQQWIQKHAVFESLSKSLSAPQGSANRRSAPPLDIVGMPGYDRLNEAERKLCSTVRLVPESYLEFKRMLIQECTKQGSLKLAQARSMIKIDVNKTRKIYDFLVQEGFVNKEPIN